MNDHINSKILSCLRRWNDLLPRDLPDGAYKDAIKKQIFEEVKAEADILTEAVRSEVTLAQVIAHYIVFGSDEAREYIAAFIGPDNTEAEEPAKHDLNWLAEQIRQIPGAL